MAALLSGTNPDSQLLLLLNKCGYEGKIEVKSTSVFVCYKQKDSGMVLVSRSVKIEYSAKQPEGTKYTCVLSGLMNYVYEHCLSCHYQLLH